MDKSKRLAFYRFSIAVFSICELVFITTAVVSLFFNLPISAILGFVMAIYVLLCRHEVLAELEREGNV